MGSPLEGIFQLAYVTPDLTRAAATLRERFGILDFIEIPIGILPLASPPGETVSMKVLVAWVGPLQIELIQPEAGGLDIYRDGLPGDDAPMRLHHVGILVNGGLADWHIVRDGLSPHMIAMEGGRGPVRFAYIDERPSLGHYVEYVWIDPDHARNSPEWRGLTLTGRTSRSSD